MNYTQFLHTMNPTSSFESATFLDFQCTFSIVNTFYVEIMLPRFLLLYFAQLKLTAGKPREVLDISRYHDISLADSNACQCTGFYH